jgi:hypothetical protein
LVIKPARETLPEKNRIAFLANKTKAKSFQKGCFPIYFGSPDFSMKVLPKLAPAEPKNRAAFSAGNSINV